MFGWDLDLPCEYTFGEGAARIILQFLDDASKFVYKTSDSGVRGANHWPPCFYAAKNGVCQVLMRAGGMQKPSVVCDVYHQIRAGIPIARKHKASGQVADGVFETDERRHFHVIICQLNSV